MQGREPSWIDEATAEEPQVMGRDDDGLQLVQLLRPGVPGSGERMDRPDLGRPAW